ncbi:ATP-binding cassette subfamily B protein [Peptoniphilus koenoeneniae]|uniref:ATP-binding cassette subfamily B protein n=1 Tax=Peptoniphilus koenoeneniae TaxID=507751 RepID=A0ABU0AV14_9FIRM|nr:ABC transporter ATP-binding protein [Peptoniphilus koenoeneniae]MDQ0275097.1 ATP-binding cassette subfamily B protein [Peptoniphilus koenoeneniae]
MKKNNIRKLSKNDNLKVGKRLLKYIIKKHKFKLIFVFFLVIFSTISGISFSVFLKTLIDSYISPLIGVKNPDFSPLLKAILTMALIFLGGTISNFIYQMIMVYVTEQTSYDLREDVFKHLQTLPISYFDENSHGDIMSVFTNDIQAVEQVIANLPILFSSIMSIILIILVMLFESLSLTLVVGLCLVLLYIIMKFMGKKSSSYFIKQQETLGEENGFIEERIEGQKIIKVFSYEDKTMEEFRKINERLFENTMLANRYSLFLIPIVFSVFNLQYAFIALAGGLMALSGKFNISVGLIATFLQLSRNLSGPMRNISSMLNQVLLALAGAYRVFNLLDQESEENLGKIELVRIKYQGDKIIECKENTGLWAWKNPEDLQNPYTPLKGDIRFNNVTFGYKEGEAVLKNISLFAKPEEKIAFVGSTGAGKTTITNLINRFYDIWSGSISFDGIDIRKINKKDLRKSLGMVLQDTHLFTGTVKENLRFGKLDATDEEIIEGAKKARAHYFIELLPKGYETIISGNGSEISQGQAQLLSIARAEILSPPVLILDEATSSIDSRTEMLVQKSMDQVMKGRTTFVIAHRLSTVQNSDAIMVLEKGNIIERGDHKDLIEQKGLYYKLYNSGLEE